MPTDTEKPKRRSTKSRIYELHPFVREQIRTAINAFAASGYLISSFEQAALVEKLIQEIRETTRQRMPSEDEEDDE